MEKIIVTLYKPKPKGENVVRTCDSQVFTSNLEKPFPYLATWHNQSLEIPTESQGKHKVLRGLNNI
jgi:hypothetical protein